MQQDVLSYIRIFLKCISNDVSANPWNSVNIFIFLHVNFVQLFEILGEPVSDMDVNIRVEFQKRVAAAAKIMTNESYE